jgi:acetyl-CoA acetyltransferase
VAIVGVYTTEQRRASGRSAVSLTMEAARGAVADAGLQLGDVDGWLDFSFPAGDASGAITTGNLSTQLGQPVRVAGPYSGTLALLQAAGAIRSGLADTVLIAFGDAPSSRQEAGEPAAADGAVDYTRPVYEFTEWTGSTTPAQMALQAREHMNLYGTTVEQLAHVAAVIRNNGMLNPAAVMFGRGPYTVEDVLASRMVAEPYTRLMCSLVNDGGSAIVVTSEDRARDCARTPVWIVGGAAESRFTSWYDPPSLAILDCRERMLEAFRRAGVTHDDVDMVSAYDHFAGGVPMEFEALGFCDVGEGGPYCIEHIGLDGLHPVCPDGGCLSHSHPRNPYNFKPIEIVRQFRGEVADLCPGWPEDVHTFDRSCCRRVRRAHLAVSCGPLTGSFSFALLAREPS